MVLGVILAIHIALAIGVIAGFVYRYILAFKNKEYPTKGRDAVFGGTAGLVITGVLLAIVGKLPITGLCLDCLGIIVGLLALEFGLQKLSGRLASENVRNHK